MEALPPSSSPPHKPTSPPLMEVAVLEYPGSLRAAAPVLSELAQRCNRTAAAGKRTGARMLVTRWTLSTRGHGMQRVAGAELFGDTPPAVIVVPGNEPSWPLMQADERMLTWLRDCHDAGSLLAGCEEGGLLLASAGVQTDSADALNVDLAADGAADVYVTLASEDHLAGMGTAASRFVAMVTLNPDTARLSPVDEAWGGRIFSSDRVTVAGKSFAAVDGHGLGGYLGRDSFSLHFTALVTGGRADEALALVAAGTDDALP